MAATNSNLPLSKRESTLNDGDHMDGESFKDEDDDFSDEDESYSVQEGDSQIKATSKKLFKESSIEKY